MQGEIFVKKLMWMYGSNVNNIKDYVIKLHKKFNTTHELQKELIRIQKNYEIDNKEYILTVLLNEGSVNENEPLKTFKEAVVPKVQISTENTHLKRHYHPSEHEKVIAKYTDNEQM